MCCLEAIYTKYVKKHVAVVDHVLHEYWLLRWNGWIKIHSKYDHADLNHDSKQKSKYTKNTLTQNYFEMNTSTKLVVIYMKLRFYLHEMS